MKRKQAGPGPWRTVRLRQDRDGDEITRLGGVDVALSSSQGMFLQAHSGSVRMRAARRCDYHTEHELWVIMPTWHEGTTELADYRAVRCDRPGGGEMAMNTGSAARGAA